MNLSDYNRFLINDNWWFSIQPDKMIFGGKFLPNNIHCTFSYGLKTGFLDLHLRKNFPNNKKVYFPVVKISAKDIYDNLEPLKLRLLNAFFVGLKEISSEWVTENSIGFIPLHGINPDSDNVFFNEVISELLSSTTKRRLSIDYEKESFVLKAQSLGERYAAKWKDIVLKPHRILDIEFGTGVLINKNYRRFFIKFNIDKESRIYLFNRIDLDHISIFRKLLGEDLYQILSSRFKEGIKTLTLLEEPKEFEEFILTLRQEND